MLKNIGSPDTAAGPSKKSSADELLTNMTTSNSNDNHRRTSHSRPIRKLAKMRRRYFISMSLSGSIWSYSELGFCGTTLCFPSRKGLPVGSIRWYYCAFWQPGATGFVWPSCTRCSTLRQIASCDQEFHENWIGHCQTGLLRSPISSAVDSPAVCSAPFPRAPLRRWQTDRA